MRDLKLNQPTAVGIRDISRLIIYKPQESSLFPFLPRVPCFSFNNRAVLVITAYGPRAMGSGTACGQPMKDSVSRGTTIGQRGMRSAGNLYERLTFSMGFHSRSWDSGQVGMSNVLSHDGDRILV